MKAEIIERNKKLIRLIRQSRMLYDHGNPSFKNPIKTTKKWQIIAKKMQMSTRECKRKWYSIRYRYMECCNTGKRYYLEKEMEFLTKHLQFFHYRYKELSAKWTLKNFIEYLEESFAEYSKLTPENKVEVMKQSHITLLKMHYKMMCKKRKIERNFFD